MEPLFYVPKWVVERIKRYGHTTGHMTANVNEKADEYIPVYGEPAPAALAAQGEPMRSAPYNPTPAMIEAARRIDPALRLEDIRALWATMWTAAPAAPVAPAGLHVGNLPTVNQDEYPNLGAWWVQIWDGDRVVGRAYGDTPHAAHEMAVKLSGNAAPSPAPASQSVSEPASPRAPCAPLTDDALWLLWTEQGLDEMSQQEAIAFARAAIAEFCEVNGISQEGGA